MPHTRTKKLALVTIRVAEIALNLNARLCWDLLERLAKLRISLDIPEFHQAIRDRDFKEIASRARQIAQIGSTPMELFYIARRGIPTLTQDEWSELISEAQVKYPHKSARHYSGSH
jgi:hypothetical protein